MNEAANAAYAERNRVVAALSKCFPCWYRADAKEPGWFVVYIELPTGQVSWHFRDEERELVAHVPIGMGGCDWDGHDTDEKYRRLAGLPNQRAIADMTGATG
jgi:hypothetical protein